MEVYNNNSYHRPQPLTVGQWVLTLFLLSLPIINFIMLFVWAFGGNRDERENFAKAALLWMVLGILLMIAFVGCVGFAAIGAALSTM